jgi:chromate transport protein ChrA
MGGGEGAEAAGVRGEGHHIFNVTVLALAALYVRFEGLPWMQGVFYGVAAAVIAILARSVVKLVRLAVGRDWLLGLIFAAAAAFVLGRHAVVDLPTALIALATLGVLLGVKKVPEPLVILAAGAVGLALKH